MAHEDVKPGTITDRAEEYLETILNISLEGKDVYAARLAERLQVSAPTVSASLRRLKRDGLVLVNEQRQIELTEPGREAATAIVRRHRLVERLLTDFLGMDWADCHKEACLLEHAISPEVEERLYERLGRPDTCPHGNPIPAGATISMPQCEQLTSIPEGAAIEIVRITEEVSDDHEMMRFFQGNGLTPGERFVVAKISQTAGTLTLTREMPSKELTLGTGVAALLFVREAQISAPPDADSAR